MDKIARYCPVVGLCPHEPVLVEPDTYFLIQPFDKEKQNREDSIRLALDTFYGNRKGHYPDGKKYFLKKSDLLISNVSVYCDICRKIKSSEYCIVDITGESFTILEDTIPQKKIFLRPNVPLELGISYGLNKPTFILSKKIDGERMIPSDIQFIRYIDITTHNSVIELINWEGAAQKILDYLHETLPSIHIKTLICDEFNIYANTKKHLEWLYRIKEESKRLRDRSLEISYIIYKNRDLIGIVLDKFLKEGLRFNFYKTDENGVEELIGIVESFHVQPEGICQVKIYKADSAPTHHLEKIAKDCELNNKHVPKKNRLELIIPNTLNNEIKEIEQIFKQLTG
jgi:hypothetical protein